MPPPALLHVALPSAVCLAVEPGLVFPHRGQLTAAQPGDSGAQYPGSQAGDIKAPRPAVIIATCGVIASCGLPARAPGQHEHKLRHAIYLYCLLLPLRMAQDSTFRDTLEDGAKPGRGSFTATQRSTGGASDVPASEEADEIAATSAGVMARMLGKMCVRRSECMTRRWSASDAPMPVELMISGGQLASMMYLPETASRTCGRRVKRWRQ